MKCRAALAVFLFSVLWISLPSALFSAQEASQTKHLSSAFESEREMLTVTTDEESAAESLDRISGGIDRGFSSKEQSYKSTKSSSPDLYERSRAHEKIQDGYGN